MIKVLNYLREQYLAVIITVIWLLFTLYSQEKNSILLKQTKQLEAKIVQLKQKDNRSSIVIDSLSKIDTVIVSRIKTIKQKEYVQVKVIDSLPISGLQKFFTDRYSEER
jgi:hypothetical protein